MSSEAGSPVSINDRFAVRPQSPTDVHRPFSDQDDLARSLTLQTARVLSSEPTTSATVDARRGHFYFGGWRHFYFGLTTLDRG